MSWIDDIMGATTEIETPRSWIWWSAISTLSAVTSSNLFLDKFYYTLSPNLFVMLLGRSGLGKGWPIWMAKEFVTKTEQTRVISGRNSIQAVVKELGTVMSRNGLPPLNDSRGFLVTGEFVNFLIQDPNSLSILTELYDTHYQKEWKNTLKGTGVETLKNVNLTLLGASSPAHFKEVVGAKDIEGGFIGRTLLIYEDKQGHINPLTTKPEFTFSIDALLPWLLKVSALKGEFQYSAKAKKIYEEWYRDFKGRNVEDKTGTAQRLHNHVEKVAMCCSLSRRLTLIIEKEDIDEAIEACLSITTNVKKALQGSGGKSEIAEHQALVLQLLLKTKEHELTRVKVLQRLFGDVDAFVLNRVIETLTEANAVTAETRGGQIFYKLTAQYLEQLEEWRRSIAKKEAKVAES